MDNETIIWIIVAVIAALALLALLAAAMRKKKAHKAAEHRDRAQQLRSEATTHVENVGHAKVGAAEAEARAERARLEAQRADSEAAEARQALAAEKEEYEQRLREADRLDPDVDHKAKDYTPTEPTAGTTGSSTTATASGQVGDSTETRTGPAHTSDQTSDVRGDHTDTGRTEGGSHSR